jgi:DNA-binding transcriptional ArsR family regulator
MAGDRAAPEPLPVSEATDPHVLEALSHVLRLRALAALQDRAATARELATELGVPVSEMAYHLRSLAETGLAALEGEPDGLSPADRPYRATARLVITDEAWGNLPQKLRRALGEATLGAITRDAEDAARAGGFDRADMHLTRAQLTLDERGWSDLRAAVLELHERSLQIGRESAARLGPTDGARVDVSLVLMLFERRTLP